MCKLESIQWAVVKSNKTISKSAAAKLSKIRNGFVHQNTFSFYFLDQKQFDEVINFLKTFKKQKFEVVRFYDKQYGMTLNHWTSQTSNDAFFQDRVKKMPLSHKFNWFDNGDRVSITPITQKQFDNIIRIN